MSTTRPIDLRFENVMFTYGNIPVLENASFHVHRGEFIALVGPNGAGKTTVLRLLLGLIKPVRGTVQLFGGPPETTRNRIGYVPQHTDYDSAFPISVREVVRMGRLHSLSRRFTKEDAVAVQEALDLAEIADLASRSYGALSGGQRRRVLVARALAAKPDLLVLDEPTANMDVESEERLYKTLGTLKGSTTIFIVTHDTAFVSALTDRVLCVGEHEGHGRGHNIVQHRVDPAEHAPVDLFGGEVFKVIHDEELPEDSCCIDQKGK